MHPFGLALGSERDYVVVDRKHVLVTGKRKPLGRRSVSYEISDSRPRNGTFPGVKVTVERIHFHGKEEFAFSNYSVLSFTILQQAIEETLGEWRSAKNYFISLDLAPIRREG